MLFVCCCFLNAQFLDSAQLYFSPHTHERTAVLGRTNETTALQKTLEVENQFNYTHKSKQKKRERTYHATSVASLAELFVGAGGLGLGADLVGLHAGGIEADVDGLSSAHVGDWAGGISSTREAHVPLVVLESDEGLTIFSFICTSKG